MEDPAAAFDAHFLAALRALSALEKSAHLLGATPDVDAMHERLVAAATATREARAAYGRVRRPAGGPEPPRRSPN